MLNTCNLIQQIAMSCVEENIRTEWKMCPNMMLNIAKTNQTSAASTVVVRRVGSVSPDSWARGQ